MLQVPGLAVSCTSVLPEDQRPTPFRIEAARQSGTSLTPSAFLTQNAEVTNNIGQNVVSLDTTETNNSFVCAFMQNTLEIKANANVKHTGDKGKRKVAKLRFTLGFA